MERAALFLDIDGTILSEVAKEIPQSALDAMRAAKRAGHLLFVIAGGHSAVYRRRSASLNLMDSCVDAGHISLIMTRFYFPDQFPKDGEERLLIK